MVSSNAPSLHGAFAIETAALDGCSVSSAASIEVDHHLQRLARPQQLEAEAHLVEGEAMGDYRRQVGHSSLEHTDRRWECEVGYVGTEHGQSAPGDLVLRDLGARGRIHAYEHDAPPGRHGLEPSREQ